jgi:hypothetical protein
MEKIILAIYSMSENCCICLEEVVDGCETDCGHHIHFTCCQKVPKRYETNSEGKVVEIIFSCPLCRGTSEFAIMGRDYVAMKREFGDDMQLSQSRKVLCSCCNSETTLRDIKGGYCLGCYSRFPWFTKAYIIATKWLLKA